METKEILLVEHDDKGQKINRPILIVDDRVIRGEPHPNGVVFIVPCAEVGESDHA